MSDDIDDAQLQREDKKAFALSGNAAHLRNQQLIPNIDIDVNPFAVDRQLTDAYEMISRNEASANVVFVHTNWFYHK